jgi:hypothetical protein
MSDAIAFLDALSSGIDAKDRMILCGFEGDPANAKTKSWRPRPWKPGDRLPFDPEENAYVAVASFHRSVDGSFRRRKAYYAAAHALMLDDVGKPKNPTLKFITDHLKPSAIVETSKNNFQCWYFFDEPINDVRRFDGLINSCIEYLFMKIDPGMSSVTRVGRLPGFTNGKASAKNWKTRLVDLDAKRRYSIDEILSAFKMPIIMPYVPPPPLVHKDVAHKRIDDFFVVKTALEQAKMLKRDDTDPSGWIEIQCPWIHRHTANADTGAAIRVPHEENGWTGAFRCHHGHCLNRGWRDLTDWLNEHAAETLDDVNRQAVAAHSKKKAA